MAVPRMRDQFLFLRRSTDLSVVFSTGVSSVLLRDVSAVVLFGCVTRRGRVCEQGHVAANQMTTTGKVTVNSRFTIFQLEA